MGSNFIKIWDRDSIPGIETSVNATVTINGDEKVVPIAYLFAFKWDEQSEIGEQYSIGTAGIHGMPTGRKQVVGQLSVYNVEMNAIASLMKAINPDIKTAPTLRDFNALGGIDITSSYTDPLSGKTYKQEVRGILFDDTASALGMDTLNQEESIGFTAKEAIGFREVA